MDNVVKLTIPAGLKPGACASESASRFTTGGAVLYATDGRGYLTATDGRCLSVVPVGLETPLERPVLLPPKGVDGGALGASVEVNGELRRTHGKRTDIHPLLRQAGRFPAIRDVFPSADALAGYTALALDVDYLARLTDAVSWGIVYMFIPPSDRKGEPVVVVGRDRGDSWQGVGVIVPLSLHGESCARAHYGTVLADVPNELRLDAPPAPDVPVAPEAEPCQAS